MSENTQAWKLLSVVLDYVDVGRLLADHPEISRADLEALRARLKPPGPPTDAPRASAAKVLVAHCDGASRGNPGPAAIGVVLEDPSGTEIATLAEPIGHTTNNVAEYVAVIRAARKARERGATELRLLLDSQLLVFQLNGTYRIRAPHLVRLNRQALEALEQFDRWSVEHVPRRLNTRADALANAALDSEHERGR